MLDEAALQQNVRTSITVRRNYIRTLGGLVKARKHEIRAKQKELAALVEELMQIEDRLHLATNRLTYHLCALDRAGILENRTLYLTEMEAAL
jgi:hypothetical protein